MSTQKQQPKTVKHAHHKHHVKRKKSTGKKQLHSSPSGNSLLPPVPETSGLLHPPSPDSAANIYDHVGTGRRRSSVMLDYYRDNYMGVETGDVTDQHLKDIRDTFELLDVDKDGKLTKAEISNLLRYIGSLKSESDMDEMLAPIDVDHNGSISFEEFKKFIIDNDVLKSLADEVCYEMQDAFNIFDKDGDGFINREELKKVLTQIGDKMPEELADEFIKEADLNGDGKIDYKEFCKHMGY